MIFEPDLRQRARFVAMNLIKAMQQENISSITASCTYLVNRLPGLIEMHASDQDSGVKIDFVEEN